MMMRNRTISIVLAVIGSVVLIACLGGGSLYNRLHRAMREVPVGDTALVRMVDLFTMPWDTMYVFEPMSYHSVPEHYQNYPEYHDIARRIILLKDGAVVFCEDETAVSEPYSVNIIDGGSFYTPQTAVFRAYFDDKDSRSDNKPHYVLLPEKESAVVAKVKENLREPDSSYYTSLELDSVTYKLKGGYNLLLYPSDSNMIYNARLTGPGIDSVVMQTGTVSGAYILRYDGADFDDYFFVASKWEHRLFRKTTGEVLLDDYGIYLSSWNSENNLIVYSGDEDIMLLNLKNMNEVGLSNYKTEHSPDMFVAHNNHLNYLLVGVTDRFASVVFDDWFYPVEIRIPGSAVRLSHRGVKLSKQRRRIEFWNGYGEYILKPDGLFEEYRRYDKEGNIIVQGELMVNGGFVRGVFRDFREGAPADSINYDTPFRFGWDEVHKIIRERSINLKDENTRVMRFSGMPLIVSKEAPYEDITDYEQIARHRGETPFPFWVILWGNSGDTDFPYRNTMTLSGHDGRILEWRVNSPEGEASMRGFGSTSGEFIARIANGEKVEVLGETYLYNTVGTERWYRIRYMNKVGFVVATDIEAK